MTNPFNPGVPNINGMSPRDDIISGMLIINSLSMPFRGIDEAVRLACDTNVTRPSCEYVADKVDALFKMVPEPVRNSVLQEAQKIEQSTSSKLFFDYDIPHEESQYALESAKIIVEGIALMSVGGVVGKFATAAYKQAKRVGKVLKNPTETPPPGLFNDINKIQPGSSGLQEVLLQGNGIYAKLGLEYSFNIDRSLHLYVNFLRTYTKAGHLAEFGSSTATSGAVFQTFRRIVNTAKQLRPTEVLVQWLPANERLILLAEKSKWLEYLGELPRFLDPEFCDSFSRPAFRVKLPPELLSTRNLGTLGVRWGTSALSYAGSKIPGVDSEDAFWRELQMSLSSFDSREPLETLRNFTLQSNQKRIAASVEEDEQEDQKPIVEVAKRTSLIAQVTELDSSQSIPGSSILKKIDEALPTNLEVSIENPTHPKKLTITVMHPIGDDDFKAGLAFSPKNPKNTTVILSKSVDDNTSVSLAIAPLNPKRSTIALSTTLEGVTGSVVVNPFKPKNSTITVSGKLDKVGLGYSFRIRKPLQGQVNVSTRVMISGVPALLAASISLRKPLESRVRLSIPVPGLTIPVVSISVKRVLKVYKKVEHTIKKLFGKKKKKHRVVEVVQVVRVDTNAAAASAEFKRGHALYYQGNLTAAWDAFSKAYSLKSNDYWHAYYIGLTALRLNERKIALEFVNKAEALNPGRCADHDSLAGTYYKLDQFTKAAGHSKRAIQINSAQAQASQTILSRSEQLRLLESRLLELPWRLFDEKIAIANQMLAIKPDHIEAQFQRAHAYYYLENFEEAWKGITKVYEQSPNHYYITYYVGLTALELGERRTALEFVDRAAGLNPGRWSDFESLAGTYYKLDQFDKVIEFSNKAIQLDSAAATKARTYLADSQKLQPLVKRLADLPWRQFDEIVATANEILTIKSSHINAQFRRAHALYYLERFEEAWHGINKVYEQSTGDYWITYYVGLTALELGERRTALEFVDRATGLNPGRWSDFESLAGTYYKLDQFDKVIEFSNKAIQLDSAAATKARTYLAHSQKLQPLVKKLKQLGLEQYDEKIATANEILAIKSNHPGALFQRAHAYYCTGNPNLAWPDIKKAYEIDFHDYSITYYVGLTALKLNDIETAIAFMIQASEHPLKKHEPHEILAGIYFKQNDLPRALQSVQRSLSINPENRKSLDLLERIQSKL